MTEKNKGSELGFLLRKRLKEQSLSLRKFSELTDIDPATVSRIMNGKRKATPDHLQRFADCLAVPASDLFIAAGYPIKPHPSDFHTSIDHIQDFLESSDIHYEKFSEESVQQELAKYEQYAQTEEGKETILQRFEDKLQKVSSLGPFIHYLKMMYEQFRANKGTPVERALIGSALIYFILPVDCIPDYIFPIGYIDDAIAVQLVVHSLKNRNSQMIK